MTTITTTTTTTIRYGTQKPAPPYTHPPDYASAMQINPTASNEPFIFRTEDGARQDYELARNHRAVQNPSYAHLPAGLYSDFTYMDEADSPANGNVIYHEDDDGGLMYVPDDLSDRASTGTPEQTHGADDGELYFTSPGVRGLRDRTHTMA